MHTILKAGTLAFSLGSMYGHDLKNKALSSLIEPPQYKVYGPLVSVLIPALQEEDYLNVTLNSIANQTYEPLEVIICDSSPPESKQLTRKLVEEWESFLSIQMIDSPSKNVSLQRNLAAGPAKGEILLILDADCILAPNFVEEIVGTLDDGAILAHGIDCYYDSDIRNVGRAIYQVFKPRLHTTGRGIGIRKKDFEAVGGYDTTCDPATTECREDLDFGARIEVHFGSGAVVLNSNAIVGESDRRPLFDFDALNDTDRVWLRRGWRKGQFIERRQLLIGK